MLSDRYKNDGKPIVNLNQKQESFKKQLENKITTGHYVFEKKPCVICESENFELLSEKDRYGLYMSVVICKNCGLIQTNPTMQESNYKEFYENEYRQIYEEKTLPTETFFKGQYNHGKLIYQFITQATQMKIKEKFIVEIETGSGGILKYFNEKGNKTVGFDLDSNYLEFGSKKNLDLRKGTSENLFSLDSKPDIIIYSHVLEHMNNPIQELETIRANLPENGLLYIEVPSVRHLDLSYEQNFLLYLQNAHLYHFTLDTLCNCTMKAGFELIKGNEISQALFKQGLKNDIFKNEYGSIMEFLKQIENNFSKPFNRSKIRGKIFSTTSKIMSKTGTLHIGQSFYYKYKTSGKH